MQQAFWMVKINKWTKTDINRDSKIYRWCIKIVLFWSCPRTSLNKISRMKINKWKREKKLIKFMTLTVDKRMTFCIAFEWVESSFFFFRFFWYLLPHDFSSPHCSIYYSFKWTDLVLHVRVFGWFRCFIETFNVRSRFVLNGCNFLKTETTGILTMLYAGN